MRHWIRKVMILGLDQDYIPFGLRNNRKGDWKRENTFWNSLGQPAYTGRVRYATGRVRYERDYKTSRTPSAQTDSSCSKPPSRRLLPHLGRPRISPKKGEREIALEKACIKVEGPGIWISHRFLVSSLKVP